MTLTTWEDPLPGQVLQRTRAVVRLPSLAELAERWSEIAPLLEKATRRTGCYEPIDLLQQAMQGRVGVWFCESEGGIDAVIATEVMQYPRKRVLEMMFCGGSNMRHWRDEAVRVLDQHARQAGCTHIACIGRRGWARAWGGAETGDVVVVRELKER